MKKKETLFIIAIWLLIIFIQLAKADVYVGTCEGYVRNTEGENVNAARVVATVDRCAVACSQEANTEITGYYVVANLNLPKFETLTVYAEKMTPLGLESGIATGTANEFQAARIDVLICLPPPLPVLVDEPNTHDTSVILDWTSYVDKKAYPTYDEFQIDSRPVIQINRTGVNSIQVTSLSFSSHYWKVRTCNRYCCSAWISDSFNVGNLPPSAPNLTDQLDTTPGAVVLNWTSGVDPDGDLTFDEYDFGIINRERKNISNATSPQREDVFSCNYYTWKVRTCEKESQHLCSSWIEDGFIACGLECPACENRGGGGGGSGGGGGGGATCEVLKQPYSLTIISPQVIDEGQELPLKLSFLASDNVKNVVFKIDSPNFNFNDYFINKVENKKAIFNMLGKLKKETKPGIYNLSLNVFVENGKAFSETLTIRVREPLLIRISRLLPYVRSSKFWFFLIIFIIIIYLVSWLIIKRKEEIKTAFKDAWQLLTKNYRLQQKPKPASQQRYFR